MLSKTMPFRAKDIDKLLRQVVKGKFTFTPEDRWRPVSAEARDLITKLLCVDPAKRLTIADVKAHPWCAAAVAKCMATMPKVKAAPAPPKSAGGAGGLLKGLGLGRGTSGTSIVPKVSKGKGKKSPFGVGYVSKEAQYWCALGSAPRTHSAHTPATPPPPHPAPRLPLPSGTTSATRPTSSRRRARSSTPTAPSTWTTSPRR
jgi:serine/threonine protein kinase